MGIRNSSKCRKSARRSRRRFLCHAGGGLVGLLALGRHALAARVPGKDKDELELPDVKTLGEMTGVYGLDQVPVDNVGLVVGLAGTGSDPPPSILRTRLLEEMKRRDVRNPNHAITSPNTAIVMVRAFLPPGAVKGDRVDVEVRVVEGSQTTSLRGGWLLETNLSYTMVAGGGIHEGPVLAKAEGPVMVSPSLAHQEGTALQRRGRILGGGVIQRNRELALALRPKYQNVKNAIRVEQVVNRRFHSSARKTAGGGVATAKRDNYVELHVDERYRHNLPRFLEVVRNLAVEESITQRHERLGQWERFLLSPQAGLQPQATARAALQLEGIGPDSVPPLKRVLEESQEPDVRFYVAEALAYLGDPVAAEELARAAMEEPAFRVFALTALTSLGDPASYKQLRRLMDSTSAETRYGAFRALWAMDRRNAFLREERPGDQFSLHSLQTEGPPLIHVTRSFRPELVLFGADQEFQRPLFLKAGPYITVNAPGDAHEVQITRFSPQKGQERRTCSPKVADVVRTAVELGASYPDVVDLLWQAQERRNLVARVEIDAVPRAGRLSARARRLQEDAKAVRRPGLLARLPNLFPEDAFEDEDAEDASKPSKGASPTKPASKTDEDEPDDDAKRSGKARKSSGKLRNRSNR